MDPLLQLTIAWALAALFSASTLHKLLALSEWPGVVRNYRLMPDTLAGLAAGVILCSGAITATALLWEPTRGVGAVAATLQFIVFGGAMEINIRRGRKAIDCGCFASRLRHGLSRWMSIRNAVLALGAMTLLLPATPRVISPFEIVVCLGLIVTLAFLYPVVAVVFVPRPPTYDENFLASHPAPVHRP